MIICFSNLYQTTGVTILFVCKYGADLVFLILHGQGESDAPAGSVAGTLQVF